MTEEDEIQEILLRLLTLSRAFGDRSESSKELNESLKEEPEQPLPKPHVPNPIMDNRFSALKQKLAANKSVPEAPVNEQSEG
jgi:hypothetical protein